MKTHQTNLSNYLLYFNHAISVLTQNISTTQYNSEQLSWKLNSLLLNSGETP